MREPRLLSEAEFKRIHEDMINDDVCVNWKEGVVEDYFYTKEILLAKKREEEINKKAKQRNKQFVVLLIVLIALIIFLSNIPK